MTPEPKPKSLQDILKQRRQSEFVGREDQLSFFRTNLTLSPENEQRRFLINVWGQGGVGKSTLLKQFSKAAEEAGVAVAYTDESEATIPAAMRRLAEQLEQQGHKLSQFSDRYRLFRQKKQELEADPEAPQGFSAFVGKTVAKAGVKLGRRVPVGGAALDFVDEDAFAEQAGEWATFVAKKLRNTDDVRLIQEPIDVLTPLFLQDLCQLGQQVTISLFFDTYEETDAFLDSWLREVIDGKYGDVPLRIVITIAGRKALADNHWADYSGLMIQFPLEAFTEAEAQQYLHRKGISNPQVIEVILQLAGRLPLLVATLASISPESPEAVGEPSDTAVERFLKWVKTPEQRQIALMAALPRKFNQDVIAQLVADGEAAALFEWLKARPFVKEQRDGWIYHQVVRAQMLRYQRIRSPQAWEAAQEKLAAYFDQCREGLGLAADQQERDADWQAYSLEALYHRLCSSPQKHLGQALNGFLVALKNQRSFALRWAEVMEAAGQDGESSPVHEWGERLANGLRAYEADEHAETIKMFQHLLEESLLKPRLQAVALAWRAKVYHHSSQYKEALKDFNRAIELDPDDQWTITYRGATYRKMERYDEALKDFNRAIELDPDYCWAITCRGATYRKMERYEEALKDFNRAIELDPDDQWTIANRGAAYRKMERYDEALKEFNHLIELDPSDQWAIAIRGATYRKMERYEEALTDLNCAIDLDPEDDWALSGRGMVLLLTNSLKAALIDFDHSLALKESDWKLCLRGICKQKLQQLEAAKLDLDRAIELALETKGSNPDDCQNLFDLASYYLVNSQFELSKQAYQEGLNQGATRAHIREAIQDLEVFLKIFPGHQQATAFRNGLQKRL